MSQGAPATVNGQRAIRHGLAATCLRSSDGATAIVADHGAHLLSWCPAGGEEALYLSPTSRYGATDAVRGGVPVIFPQFGEQGSGKRHGIARVQPWTLQSVTIEDGAAVACLRLQGRLPEPNAQDQPDHGKAEFSLTLQVRLHGAMLELGLTIENTGRMSWSCQAALHTYLRVDAVEHARIEGLQGCRYIDQTASGAVSVQSTPHLDVAGEIDRIYTDAPSRLRLRDGRRRLDIAQRGFANTVVWNPGPLKAATLADLPAQGYREFVCIESAAIAARLVLAPGTSWHALQQLSVLTPGT